MISVPLPVKMGWYAYHFTASAAEAQIRMTHAMWMAILKAHPMAPHDLKEVRKLPVGKAAKPARPRRAARSKPTTKTAAPSLPAAEKSASKSKEPSKAKPGRKRRAPSAPPPMPNGRADM